MARSNGGIIGKSNKSSFGKNKITAVNATGCFTSQPGTTLISAMLAGGGGGTSGVRNTPGAGGGGGGVVLHPGLTICGNTSYPIVIGAGGTAGTAPCGPVSNLGTPGCNTTGFGLTALGGGKSIFSGDPLASTCSSDPFSGSGGSGGGIMGGAPAATSTQGLSLQACQPGDSGIYGYGNRGGNVDDFAPGGTASGGGAGSAGTRGTSPPTTPDAGGNGLDITPFFGAAPQPFYTAAGFIAGGGGAGGRSYPCSPNSAAAPGGGGIGQGMASGAPRPGGGTDGGTNTGGGGGAKTSTETFYPLVGSSGGSGQVLVKELNKASGVWSLQSQFQAVKQGSWPYLGIDIDYLVIAGGGGSGNAPNQPVGSGGGGAGGYRTSYCGGSGGGASPESKIFLAPSGGTFTITVGGGGAGGPPAYNPGNGVAGTSGNDSVICGSGVSITSTGGGGGAGFNLPGIPGGSGGGAVNAPSTGGTGTANQGFPGGTGGSNYFRGAGGGGAGGAGGTGGTPGPKAGGAGLTSSITGSPVARGGGGGGGGGGTASAGGGAGSAATPGGTIGTAGAANTGGGGGGSYACSVPGPHPILNAVGGASGGSGIVVVRTPSAYTVAVTPCTNTVASCVGPANDKVATFTVSGTLTLS